MAEKIECPQKLRFGKCSIIGCGYCGSHNFTPNPPMPNKNIEEKVEEFRREFVQDNCPSVEDSFKDPNGDAGYATIWLRQALLSVAQQSRNEALEEIARELLIKGDMGKLTPFQQTVNTYILNRLEEIKKPALSND